MNFSTRYNDFGEKLYVTTLSAGTWHRVADVLDQEFGPDDRTARRIREGVGDTAAAEQVTLGLVVIDAAVVSLSLDQIAERIDEANEEDLPR